MLAIPMDGQHCIGLLQLMQSKLCRYAATPTLTPMLVQFSNVECDLYYVPFTEAWQRMIFSCVVVAGEP